MVSPLVERAGRQHAGRLKVVKLNVDEAPAISDRYQVRGIPLLVLFRDRSEVDRLVGAVRPAIERVARAAPRPRQPPYVGSRWPRRRQTLGVSGSSAESS